MVDGGARLAIRLLQEAAERGEIDPWDVDVIAVIDGFLDQLRQRLALPRLVGGSRAGFSGSGGSYERDLDDSSEAFLAASILVSLKAEVLEASTLPPEPLEGEEALDLEGDGEGGASWWDSGSQRLPSRPERHLWRRPVAPPPLQRPVTLGELIRQLEDIAERLEQDQGQARQRQRSRRYSERAAIEQVAALAHREKLPETTAALSRFLQHWPPASAWVNFEQLVQAWAQAVQSGQVDPDLDRDRVGVFWALLFLCHQGRVELEQEGGLYAELHLRNLIHAGSGWIGEGNRPGGDEGEVSAAVESAGAPAALRLVA